MSQSAQAGGLAGRSLPRDFVANLLGKAWAVAAVYLFVPLYIGRLGVEAYGLIAFNAVALAVLVLADVGLSAAMTRQAARVRDTSVLAGQLRVVESVLLAAVGAAGAALALAAPFIAGRWLGEVRELPLDDVITSLRLMALGLVPQVAVSLYFGILMGRQRQVAANAWNAAFIFVRSALVLLPLAWRPDVTVYFAWQALASWVFFGLFRRAALREIGEEITLAPRDWAAMRELSVYAGGMFTMGLLSAATAQLDRVVVSALRPLQEFSFYALAATLAQVPTLLAVPISASLLPRLTALVANGSEPEARRLYERGSYVVASLAGASGAAVILFSSDLLHIWLRGAAFPSLLPTVAALLAVGGVALALQLMPFQLSLAHGHTATNIRVGVAVLALAIPSQWFLTSRFGLLGAALPWLIVGLVGSVYLGVRLNQRFRATPAADWFALCCGVPLAVSASTLGLGRGLANAISAGPLAAVMVAGLSAAVALGGCYAVSGRTLALVARRTELAR